MTSAGAVCWAVDHRVCRAIVCNGGAATSIDFRWDGSAQNDWEGNTGLCLKKRLKITQRPGKGPDMKPGLQITLLIKGEVCKEVLGR